MGVNGFNVQIFILGIMHFHNFIDRYIYSFILAFTVTVLKQRESSSSFKYLISKYEDGDIIHNNHMNININNLNIENNRNPRSNFGQRWRLTVNQP